MVDAVVSLVYLTLAFGAGVVVGYQNPRIVGRTHRDRH